MKVFRKQQAILFVIMGVFLAGLFLSCASIHIYVVDDAGSRKRVVAFRSMSVSSVLTKAGTKSLRQEDVVSPDVGVIIPRGEIAITRARPVTLTIDDVSQTVYSTARTVSQFLSENGVKVNKNDKISPAETAAVPYTKDIVVKRTTYSFSSTTQVVAYNRVYKKNPFMEAGRSYISVMGQNGVIQKTVKTTKVAKKPVANTVVKTTIVKPVVHEVYDVGSAHLDVKPLRSYTMSATAYSNYADRLLDGKDHLYGYSGLSLHYGTCAVDRHLIPMGTVLYVEGYGYAVAADIGGAIRGKRIDLFFSSYDDACQWGRRSVKVYVLPLTRAQLYHKLGID